MEKEIKNSREKSYKMIFQPENAEDISYAYFGKSNIWVLTCGICVCVCVSVFLHVILIKMIVHIAVLLLIKWKIHKRIAVFGWATGNMFFFVALWVLLYIITH